ncbi:MAG: glycosyltransferase family 4 protein [Armatimonadota bacterium]
MHVLILPSFYPNDEDDTSGLFFRDQAVALQRQGLQVGVCVLQGRSLRRGITLRGLRENRFQTTAETEYGLTTLRMHGWNPYAQSAFGGYVMGWLYQALVRRYCHQFGTPDVLHAHCTEWAGYGALLVARQRGIPYVITEHMSSFAERLVTPVKGRLFAHALAGASAVVAVSRSLVRAMEPYLGGKEAVIIPNMVDTEFFSPPETSPALPPFVFACVARLANVKGVDVLLRAFAHSFHGDNTVQLVIVGDGPERPALQQLCATLGLAHQVRFTGAASPAEVRITLGGAHAFVLSSYLETFAVVVIEAMSMGLPVVATRCGGPEEIVTPDVGLLVAPGNIEALASAMTQVRQEYHRFDHRQLRTMAQERFGMRIISKHLMALYQQIAHPVTSREEGAKP